MAIKNVKAVEHHGDDGLWRQAAVAAARVQRWGQTWCECGKRRWLSTRQARVLALWIDGSWACRRSKRGQRLAGRLSVETWSSCHASTAAVKCVVEEHAGEVERGLRLETSNGKSPLLTLNGASSRRDQLPAQRSRPGASN
jgi:hypothetical protein